MTILNDLYLGKDLVLETMARKMPRAEGEIFLKGSSTAALNEYAKDEKKAIGNIIRATERMEPAQKEIFFEGYKNYQELD